MKFAICTLLTFASLSAKAAAPTCGSVFFTSRTSFIKSVIELQEKTKNEPYDFKKKYHIVPTQVEARWSEKVNALSSKKETLDLVQDIIHSLDYLPSEKWKTMLQTAAPILLPRLETLDSTGVIDIADVAKIVNGLLIRSENFRDQTIGQTLRQAFDMGTLSGYPKMERPSIFAVVEKRAKSTYRFQRKFEGALAEQLFLSMNIPETNVDGIIVKTLRSMDRSVLFEIQFDTATGTYQASLKADTNSAQFVNSDPTLYKFVVTTKRWDNDFFLKQGAGPSLREAMAGAEYAYFTRQSVQSISFKDQEGRTPIELTSTSASIGRFEARSGTYSNMEFTIEIPKDLNSYEGGQSLKEVKVFFEIERENLRRLTERRN